MPVRLATEGDVDIKKPCSNVEPGEGLDYDPHDATFEDRQQALPEGNAREVGLEITAFSGAL
ncbi:MAG: hypothetical protein LUQ26_09430 [Methylococcaceae bacterium]|nr:hypothetical protein [Methylococcaceae bacterium]